MNIMKTAVLIAAMTGLFLAIGFLLGGNGGLVIAFIIALGMNFYAYWNSDKMVLKMYSATEVDDASSPVLVKSVRELAMRADLPMPKVYVINNDQPNAFATGRNPENAAVAATTGLMRLLNREELAGVMAHELAHIKNRDTLIMTVTATFAGAISMLANFALFFGRGRDNPIGLLGSILLMFLAPVAAGLVQMAISRTREYEADRIGAEICGNPLALASALNRLESGAKRIDNHQAESNPATAHMFIVNPLHAHKRDALFSTHPNMQNRIHALEGIAGMPLQNARFRNHHAVMESPNEAPDKPSPWSNPKTQSPSKRRGPWG